MDNNQTSGFLNTVVWNKSSAFNNDTGTNDSAIYVFTPALYAAKQVLCFLLACFGGIGFVGCCLILYFLRKKPRKKSTTGKLFCKESEHVCEKSLPVRPAFLCGVYATCLSADVVRCVPKRVGL